MTPADIASHSPETKQRTLEEIGELFGDTHVASHWYTLTPEEREKVALEALELSPTGTIPEKNHGNEKAEISNEENISKRK